MCCLNSQLISTLQSTGLKEQAAGSPVCVACCYHALNATLPILTHCILVDFSTIMCWTSPFVIVGRLIYSIIDRKSC